MREEQIIVFYLPSLKDKTLNTKPKFYLFENLAKSTFALYLIFYLNIYKAKQLCNKEN